MESSHVSIFKSTLFMLLVCVHAHAVSLTCFTNADCGGIFNPNDNLCCSDGKCCNSTAFCAEDKCPGPWDAVDATYCCAVGCCTKKQHGGRTGKSKHHQRKCPGRHDTSDEHYNCKNRCCSILEYFNKGYCISSSGCPGYYDTAENKYCCKNNTCCRIDDNDHYTTNDGDAGDGNDYAGTISTRPAYKSIWPVNDADDDGVDGYEYTDTHTSYTSPTEMSTGTIIAIVVAIKIIFWTLIYCLRWRKRTRDGSVLIIDRRRNHHHLLTESPSTESLNEDTAGVQTIPASNHQHQPNTSIGVNKINETVPPSYDDAVMKTSSKIYK